MTRKYQNILAIWKIIRWFDNARWNLEEMGENLIPGHTFRTLSSEDKILTHWLAYITDQQRRYEDVWEKGGRIFSEIAEEYKKGGNPLTLLRKFIKYNGTGKKVDTLISRGQKLQSKRIEYIPRYGMHILSIARTLQILRHFDRSIIKYLSNNWNFISEGKGFASDTRVLRIAFLLYLLSYKDIKWGFVSFHKGQSRLVMNVRRYEEKLKFIMGNALQLRKEFNKWLGKGRYHKRLWAALRDYMKPGNVFSIYFKKAFTDTENMEFSKFLGRESRVILPQLEFPGDIWNLRFIKNIFRGRVNSPKDLRTIYEKLKVNIDTEEYYPEQFDVSWSFSQYMCDEGMEEFCPFRKDSKLKSYCFGKHPSS